MRVARNLDRVGQKAGKVVGIQVDNPSERQTDIQFAGAQIDRHYKVIRNLGLVPFAQLVACRAMAHLWAAGTLALDGSTQAASCHPPTKLVSRNLAFPTQREPTADDIYSQTQSATQPHVRGRFELGHLHWFRARQVGKSALGWTRVAAQRDPSAASMSLLRSLGKGKAAQLIALRAAQFAQVCPKPVAFSYSQKAN